MRSKIMTAKHVEANLRHVAEGEERDLEGRARRLASGCIRRRDDARERLKQPNTAPRSRHC